MIKVHWDNECGYGVEEFDDIALANDFIAECKRHGTNAYLA